MTELEKILIERDDLTLEEAKELIDETRDIMLEEGTLEPMMDILGIEPDYLFDIF